MRTLVATLLVLWPLLAPAKVLNVEFKFTPFTGDPKEDHVETVAGKVVVFLDNVPIAEQVVRKDTVPVIFEEREIAPSVWVPAQSLGPAVRKGKNTIRVEFEPADASTPYRAQLRWATVTDQVKEESAPGTYKGTNQADQGVDDKQATGKLVMEREFFADFATDRAWHHLPPVTSLTDEDKQQLTTLVRTRADWFKPEFASVYKALEGKGDVDAARVRKTKCLDAAYKAGVRITAVPDGELEFVTTGGPEVVVRGKNGFLYPPDPKTFERIKGDDVQMCAGMVLTLVYQSRLVAARAGASGAWEVVY